MTQQMTLDVRLQISYDCDPSEVEEVLRSLVNRGVVMEPLHAGLELSDLQAVIIGHEVRPRFESYEPIRFIFSPDRVRNHLANDSDRLAADGATTVQEAANALGDDDLFLAADKVVAEWDVPNVFDDVSRAIVRHAAEEAGLV